jgi:hypothetical protein
MSYVFCIIGALVFTSTDISQKPTDKQNPEVARMSKEVSSKNIGAAVLKLVSFGTRNTLSERNDPAGGGVGAASD